MRRFPGHHETVHSDVGKGDVPRGRGQPLVCADENSTRAGPVAGWIESQNLVKYIFCELPTNITPFWAMRGTDWSIFFTIYRWNKSTQILIWPTGIIHYLNTILRELVEEDERVRGGCGGYDLDLFFGATSRLQFLRWLSHEVKDLK